MKYILLASGLLLAGCQLATDGMTAAGVKPASVQVIAADTAAAGQLFCQYGPTLLAANGVKVQGASASSVSLACAALAIPGVGSPIVPPVPVTAPAGAIAVVATPDAASLVAVEASKQ